MTERPYTPLLDQVHEPADLNSFSDAELHQLAEELRAETISVVSETGGHLGAGCLLYTSPSPRDVEESRMPSSA